MEVPEVLLAAAAASLLLAPYLLPKMQDRYFYPFELTAIILACLQPRYVVVALASQVTGVIAYLALADISSVAVRVAALPSGLLLIFLVQGLGQGLKAPEVDAAGLATRPA